MLKPTYRFTLGLLTGATLATVVARARGKRSRKTFVVDRAVLPDAIPHVVYEYSNLVHSGDYVANRSPGGPIGVHVGDVFLLNCRKLGDFFNTHPTDKPDVRAVHFCNKNPMPALEMRHFQKWKLAMDQNLAHISYKRVTKPIVFYDKRGSARVNALTEEIRAAFRIFLDHIDDEYKPTFAAALSSRGVDIGNIAATLTSGNFGDRDVRVPHTLDCTGEGVPANGGTKRGTLEGAARKQSDPGLTKAFSMARVALAKRAAQD